MTIWNQILPALHITRREVRDQFRDWRIIFPILGLTVFFPFLMNFTARQALDFVERYGAAIVAERLVPFLFMVVGFFPISVSLVIALETFVGEKERGSIEPLLNTPLKDWQLYLGKLLSATVPPLFSSYLGMAVYLGGLVVTDVEIPSPVLLFQLVALTTVQAFVMVAAAVVISTQTTSVRAANLLASFIVIPSALLIQGESIVVFWGDFSTLWWAVLGMGVFAVLLIRVGMAHFRREELLGREIDVLNIRWGWRIFSSAFIAGSRNALEWYRSIAKSLKVLIVPAMIVLLLLIAGIVIGYTQADLFQIPLENLGLGDIQNRLGTALTSLPSGGAGEMAGYFWNNLRVLLLALPLGFISFGVLGVFPTFLSLGVVGYLMGLLNQMGISPMLYLTSFILPHGIFEIPAAILASAAVLRMGAKLAVPETTRTVSEIWLELFGEWAKIMVGVVIPLLILAAIVEAFLTPKIAMLMLQ